MRLEYMNSSEKAQKTRTQRIRQLWHIILAQAAIIITLVIYAAILTGEAAADIKPVQMQGISNPTAAALPEAPDRPDLYLSHGETQAELTRKPEFALTPKTEPELTYLGEFTCYAYCACDRCCGKSDGVTASGAKAEEGITVAADAGVLPSGSEIFIGGIGFRTVQDTGVTGQALDLYFERHQDAIDFGVQTVKVWLITEN